MSDVLRVIIGEGKHQEEIIATREAVRDWTAKVIESDPALDRPPNVVLDKSVQIQLVDSDSVIYYYIVRVTWAECNEI